MDNEINLDFKNIESYYPHNKGLLHIIPNVTVIDATGKFLGKTTIKEYL